MKPAPASAAASASGLRNLPRRKRRSHEGQKRRLVHTRQRARATDSPQSQQKLGLYIETTPSPLRTRAGGASVSEIKRRSGGAGRASRVGTHAVPGRRALYAGPKPPRRLFCQPPRRLFASGLSAASRFTCKRALHAWHARDIVLFALDGLGPPRLTPA